MLSLTKEKKNNYDKFIEKILKVEECYSNVEETYIELLSFAK